MKKFRTTVYAYYRRYGRDLPWRKTRDPFCILVSEIMLQQTQVSRVLEKYPQFIRAFPDPVSLAKAPLGNVLNVWQGMGYNRRALALKKLAQRIVLEFGGKVPRQREQLLTLPGIGEASSGAICAFAFNKPEVFIETNIRSVFLHHFFRDKRRVSDEQLIPYIAKAMDRKNPRAWYSALMDYGVYLKGRMPNPSRRSLHYKAQGRFEGSDRQIRGRVLKELLRKGRKDECSLISVLGTDRARAERILASLRKEGLVTKRGRFLTV